jgi:hypothetical protein
LIRQSHIQESTNDVHWPSPTPEMSLLKEKPDVICSVVAGQRLDPERAPHSSA